MPGSNSRPNVSEGYEVPTELPGSTGYMLNTVHTDTVLFLSGFESQRGVCHTGGTLVGARLSLLLYYHQTITTTAVDLLRQTITTAVVVEHQTINTAVDLLQPTITTAELQQTITTVVLTLRPTTTKAATDRNYRYSSAPEVVTLAVLLRVL